jgi:hypothetical protein
MAVDVTPVSRSLDKKLLILGFELVDLLAVFLFLALLNFFFGGGGVVSLALTWLPPLALALLLKYGKRGKPDNYLLHLTRFHFNPGIYSAFQLPKNFKSPPSVRRIGGL